VQNADGMKCELHLHDLGNYEGLEADFSRIVEDESRGFESVNIIRGKLLRQLWEALGCIIGSI